MKKIALLLVFIVFGSVANAQRIGQMHNVRVGQTFAVALPVSGDEARRSWKAVVRSRGDEGPVIEELSQQQTGASMPGEPEFVIFPFKALREGNTYISFNRVSTRRASTRRASDKGMVRKPGPPYMVYISVEGRYKRK